MATPYERLLDLHGAIEQEITARMTTLAEKEADAQRIIQQCFEERKQIDRERSGLRDAERIYRDVFTAGGNAPPRPATIPYGRAAASLLASPPTSDNLVGDYPEQQALQTRARIGPQRFLMLDAINTLSDMTVEEIAALTRLPLRRVREQMMSDSKLGVVTSDWGKFRLTVGGLDLLERYKAYKRSNGQPLPTADDPSSDEDRDEHEVPDTEGEPVGRSQEPERAPEPTAERTSILD